MHQGVGGHFFIDITIMHKDVLQYCQSCDDYQCIQNLVNTIIAKLVTTLPT